MSKTLSGLFNRESLHVIYIYILVRISLLVKHSINAPHQLSILMMSQKRSKKSGIYVQKCTLLSYFGSHIK